MVYRRFYRAFAPDGALGNRSGRDQPRGLKCSVAKRFPACGFARRQVCRLPLFVMDSSFVLHPPPFGYPPKGGIVFFRSVLPKLLTTNY